MRDSTGRPAATCTCPSRERLPRVLRGERKRRAAPAAAHRRSDGRQWRHLLEDPWLTERFRVIAWDLPYHGKSLPPDGVAWWQEPYKLTLAFFLDFIESFARELALDRPVFMGCSMGGHIAMDLARWKSGLCAR